MILALLLAAMSSGLTVWLYRGWKSGVMTVKRRRAVRRKSPMEYWFNFIVVAVIAGSVWSGAAITAYRALTSN